MREFFLWLAKFVVTLFVVLVVVPTVLIGLLASLPSVLEEEVVGSQNVVAVVDLEGMILDSEEVVDSLYKQAEDDSVKGIVLRVNSPGGAVAPSQAIYHAILDIRKRKPVVASFGNLAASGGLYAALGASRIYAHEGTITGSIGVLLQLPNVSQIADRFGFQMVTITSGRLKDAGNAFKPLEEEERSYFQETIQVAYRSFVEAVADGRNLPLEEVKKFADGRILLGITARELGIIDEIGGTRDAARAVFEILGQPLPDGESPTLRRPSEKFRVVRELFSSVSRLFLSLESQGPQLLYLLR